MAKKLVFDKLLLKEIRMDLGKTQREMASLLEVSYSTYQKWELGETQPTRSIENIIIFLSDEKEVCEKVNKLFDVVEETTKVKKILFNGETLRKKRKEMGITQCELADLIGVHSRIIGQWENGVHTPRKKHIEVLAKAFDCSMEELII